MTQAAVVGGWWLLLPIVNLIFLVLDSQSGDNRFGPNPKAAYSSPKIIQPEANITNDKQHSFVADDSDSVHVKFNSNMKAYLPILVLIGVGMLFWLFVYSGFNFSNKSATSFFSKDVNTFDIYECKGDADACKKHLGVIKFNVDKTTLQVVEQNTPDGEKDTNLIKLDDCVIVDFNNWQCGGIVKREGAFESLDTKFIMTDGELTVKDGYLILRDAYGKITDNIHYESKLNWVKR